MSPYTAESARTTQAKPNRPTPVGSRILPAVPLAFSRPPPGSQATTPPLDPSPTPAVRQSEYLQNGKTDGHATLPQSPLTPESKGEPEATSESEKQSSPDPAVVGLSQSAVLASSREDKSTTDAPTSGNRPALSQQPQNPPKAAPRIPRELPPPFYPSAENHLTPTSSTSSNAAQHNSTNNAIIYHPRPSNNRIVFGGYPDSSNSSPAPPSGGMMAYPPPPPLGYYPHGGGYGPPPFFPPGHAPHLSDPNVGLMYPPMGMPLGNGYGYRRDQQPIPMPGRQQHWIMPDGPVPYPLRHHEPYSPRHMHAHMNGAALDPHSRSGSQASTRTQEKDTSRVSHTHPSGDNQASNGTHVNNYSKEIPIDVSLLSLRDHMLSHFGAPEFAEYTLHVVHSKGDAPATIFPIHGIVASRSPVLLSSIMAFGAQEPTSRPKVLRLLIKKEFYNHLAVTEAIKFLYGGRLLAEHGLELGLPAFVDDSLVSSNFNPAQENMAQAIAYAAIGQALEVAPIVSSGSEVMGRLLRWDTVEKALEFALDDNHLPVKNGQVPNGLSSDYRRASPDSYKLSLLNTIVEFVASSFPNDFELNTNAPPLARSPLLPVVVDARPQSHHPRLSQIRFGELPPETVSTRVTTLLSSILVSLPFNLLKRLLEHPVLGSRLGSEKLAVIAQVVVDERERRLQKVATSKEGQGIPYPAEDPLWQNIQYEERIEQTTQNNSGFQVSRRFVGLGLPRA